MGLNVSSWEMESAALYKNKLWFGGCTMKCQCREKCGFPSTMNYLLYSIFWFYLKSFSDKAAACVTGRWTPLTLGANILYMISVYFAVTGKLATNPRAPPPQKKRERCYTSEAKHLVRVDWHFGSGLKWNQLLTFLLFFPQPSACSSYLSPAKFQIVRASPQLLATVASGLYCHHLHTKLAASDLAPCTALTTFSPSRSGHRNILLWPWPVFGGVFCCCLYFTMERWPSWKNQKASFCLPLPPLQKFLFHMGLHCGFGVKITIGSNQQAWFTTSQV